MMRRLAAVIAASVRRAQPLGPRCRSQALITALLSPARRYQAARRERNFSTHSSSVHVGTRARVGRLR